MHPAGGSCDPMELPLARRVQHRTSMKHVIVIGGFAMALGCGSSGGDAPAPGTPAPGSAAAAAPAPAVASRPRIYFVSMRNQVTVGDAAGFRVVSDPTDPVFHVLPLDDGRAWIATKAGLRLYDGARLADAAKDLVEFIPRAAAPDGVVWGAGKGTIVRVADAKARSWTLAEAGAGASAGLVDMVAGPDGRVYVSAGRQLLIGDGTAWKAVAAPDELVLRWLTLAGDGTLYVSAGPPPATARAKGALFALRGDALVKIADQGTADVLEPGGDGSVLVGRGRSSARTARSRPRRARACSRSAATARCGRSRPRPSS